MNNRSNFVSILKNYPQKLHFFINFYFNFILKIFEKNLKTIFVKFLQIIDFFLIRRKKLENKNVLKIVVNISWLIYQKMENS